MSGFRTIEGKLDAKGLKTAVIASRFNDFITSKLVEGAIDCLLTVSYTHLTLPTN